MARWSAFSTVVLTASVAVAPGCLDRPIEPVEPRITTTIVERLIQSSVDKIDLLLAIDNSRSMADKQEILNLAVPDLVNELVNPNCLDADGIASDPRPASPLDECPDGYEREFKPVVDIHIGVITSSLGDHGGDVCPDDAPTLTNNDLARLLTRDASGGTVPTYQSQGFLAWDPSQKLVPAGEADQTTLVNNLAGLVSGAGEVGCGFEAQLESWYRFLVDPNPYLTIEEDGGKATMSGTDDVLLQQRADFMRPDSLLAIIMLSDENDCSIRDGSQYFYAAKAQAGSGQYHLPKAQITCESNPEDPCCRSCGQDDSGCPPKGAECEGSHDVLSDAINLRCFNQKQRFGIDFLQPIDRYVTGLTAAQVSDRDGNVVGNPIFTDLKPDDDISNVRDPGLVFVAGIVGVPWQDIARKNDQGQPDLLQGVSADGETLGGFQSGTELIQNGTWNMILGDPTCYVTDPDNCLPDDPLMIESVEPRTGTHPITGDPIAAPTAGYMANSINGHEWSAPLLDKRDDLQYACIFPLAGARDCGPGSTEIACDCSDAANDNPLCKDQSGAFGTTQYQAKAYPGRRELELLNQVGDQGIVASICPAQQTDQARKDFGYRPAIGAIVERLKQALGGQCLPRTLTANEEGQVPCLILEATNTGGACNCDVPGRQPVAAEHQGAVDEAKEDPLYQTAAWDCFCEIQQLTGNELQQCQDVAGTDCPASGVDGWCYVDASTVPPTGNPDIVASCPPTEQRIIRFVCNGKGAAGATLFITCSGE
ncbi:MAG: hypothetical protein JRI23_07755 [Deltaproteobacteria bacterium]|nr:hypothetical protein [Deltaproteobacteria bacterium]MBW2531500.1 hypothetical protein [Deltaproteobacteria bacterium]